MDKNTKERRCLKFTTYIFIPDKDDTWPKLREFSANLGMGRVEIFDEFNNKIKGKGNGVAFGNVGQFLDIILKEYAKRARKRLPRKTMKIPT